MRIISGISRGIKLNEPQNQNIRPTIDRVKEGIFSAIQFEIQDKKILDLFSGTGQLGIEAISRGAKNCVFVDDNLEAHNIEIQNLKKAKLFGKAKIIKQDSIEFLKQTKESYDIVFLDPPYKTDLIDSSLKELEGRLNKGGMVICEHLRTNTLEERIGSFCLHKTYKYGKIQVTIYRLKEDE